MERKTTIIIGVAAGVLVLGGIIGAVVMRRAALEREFEGGTLPPGQTGSATQPGGGTVPPGGTQPGGLEQPPKTPPPPGAAAPSTSDPNVPAPPSGPPTPNTVDTDGDGLSNEQEQQLGTDPNNVDTDGDGYYDGAEVNALKTDPKVKTPRLPR